MIDDILREVEHDALPDAAARVTSLATDYLGASGRAEGAVSPTVPRDAVDARFDEPLPEDGCPLADVVQRIRVEQNEIAALTLFDCSRLAQKAQERRRILRGGFERSIVG